MGFMPSGNTGDFGGNLTEIDDQSFDKLLENPTRGKRRFPRYGSCLSVYREAFISDEK